MLRWRWTAAVALTAAVAGCSAQDVSDPPPGINQGLVAQLTEQDVTGTVSVPGTSWTNTNGELCDARLGYEDIGRDTRVVVTDAAGVVVGTATLSSGSYEDGRCVFAFVADGAVGDSEFYGVEVGHRGVVPLRRDELSWPVRLTIG